MIRFLLSRIILTYFCLCCVPFAASQIDSPGGVEIVGTHSALVFGRVRWDKESDPQTFTIRNNSKQPLMLGKPFFDTTTVRGAILLSKPFKTFELAADPKFTTCKFDAELKSGESCTVGVVFKPLLQDLDHISKLHMTAGDTELLVVLSGVARKYVKPGPRQH